MNRRWLVFVVVSIGAWGAAGAPLGEPGRSAMYRASGANPDAASVVETVRVSAGPVEPGDAPAQWMHLEATKRNGDSFEVWLLASESPGREEADARRAVTRYIVREAGRLPTEYRHRVTGEAVVPMTGAWPYLLPRGANTEDPFPEEVQYLGHRYIRELDEQREPVPAPADARVVALRPDVLTGVPHNTRQSDERRRYDDSEYDYIPMTHEDFEALIAAGTNCFRAEPDLVDWFEDAGVFYWGVSGGALPYPECLYRPLYIGPALFLDEPAVVTRDYRIRPRLREDPEFRRAITLDDALAAFTAHFAEVVDQGAPTRLLASLRERPDVDLGAMQFLQESIYTWETMIATGAHQLLYRAETPGAIVFEPPGQLGLRRTLPAMNMSYGCQIPVTGQHHFLDIIIGFLRGAARASGKEWGISVYGGVDVVEAPRFFSRAYELGATRFFFWDNARLACVPFGEVLDLTRHLSAQARNYPHRDLDRLRNAGEVLILLPPGYNLGHVFMGKGILWGVGELNLERRNRDGVPYRTVMANFFTEIERCLRLGVAFDLLWDIPDLPHEGYREVVRVLENGSVEIAERGGHTVLQGARIPERPAGTPPRLEVTLSAPEGSGPYSLIATAHVTEGDAPVYFAPEPDAQGIHHNRRVVWELYGPNEEDYTHRVPGITLGSVEPEGDGHRATATLQTETPGSYRLRVATTDLAGRSAVVWKDFTID